MTEELEKLREYLHSDMLSLESLEGVVNDIVVKNRSDKELLIKLCVKTGILQSFIKESSRDILFINSCTRKLTEEHFFSESAVELAIAYCRYLSDKEPEMILEPISNFYLWGFKEIKSGKIIIDYIFDNVDCFSDGLAAVQMRPHWGYIDYKKQLVISYKYSYAGRFHKDTAWVGSYKGNGLQLSLIHI